jgi:hypothetical protein
MTPMRLIPLGRFLLWLYCIGINLRWHTPLLGKLPRLARIPALSIVVAGKSECRVPVLTQGEASLPHKNPTAFLVMAGDGVFQENVRIRTCSRLLSATAASGYKVSANHKVYFVVSIIIVTGR